jgi:hypothetical protein
MLFCCAGPRVGVHCSTNLLKEPSNNNNINWLCDTHILGSSSNLFSLTTHFGYIRRKIA